MATSSSPRPAPMSTTVSRPASRTSRTRACANSGEACTEVRKWAIGDSRRKNPAAPYSASSHAAFQVGAEVGGGTAGIPREVLVMRARLRGAADGVSL